MPPSSGTQTRHPFQQASGKLQKTSQACTLCYYVPWGPNRPAQRGWQTTKEH